MTSELIIEVAGPLTTIQDGGRPGFMRFGVPGSGPVDRTAFVAATTSVGTDHAIEISLGGLAIRCASGDIGFALCGGDFVADIDGRALGSWCRSTLSAGQRMRVRQGSGQWAYLAFAGSLRCSTWLGSRSTHALSGLGGGLAKADDRLVIDNPAPTSTGEITHFDHSSKAAAVRVVVGPQDRYFTSQSLAALFDQSFTPTARFNRMGRAIDGPALTPKSVSMPSEPAIRGCLQIDGSGKMTILLADHQTTGGYPKIATVIGCDVDRVSQWPSDQPLRFTPVTPAEAETIARSESDRRCLWLENLLDLSSLDQRLMTRNLIGGIVDASDPSGLMDT